MKIVVTGSIAYDYLMRFPGRFKEHLIPEELHQVSLSFLVEEMTKHWGGVAANITFTMGKLGLNPYLMGTVGRDFSDYRVWLDEAGVNTSTVKRFDKVFTASFFANTDLDNNQICSFYSGAMAYAKDYKLSDALKETPDLVVISPNDPVAMMQLAEECRERNIRFIYDPSQQIPRLSGEELRASMQGAYAMIVNAYEANMIAEKTGLTLKELKNQFEVLVITAGKNGSTIYTNNKAIEVEAIAPNKILDPTGAGDAYRAGFITGLANDFPLQLCGQLGALCATYVLEHVGTQNHDFTVSEFVQRFRKQFDDAGQLNRLTV